MSQIRNGSPQVYAQGVDDQSIEQMPFDPVLVPTFVPHLWFFSPKGEAEPELVSGASLVSLFGAEATDEVGPYATHASVMLNRINATGTSIIAQRLIPKDAGPLATLRLSYDMLKEDRIIYERETDGSIKKDPQGNPIPTGEVKSGYRAMFRTSIIEPDATTGEDMFAQGTIGPGALTDDAGVEQSRNIPVMDLRVPFIGSEGNRAGLSLWAPNTRSGTPLNDSMMREVGAFPFRFAFLRRADNGSSRRVASLSGEQFVDLVFKPDAVDPLVGNRPVSVSDRLVQDYQRLDATGSEKRYGPFKDCHVYLENVEEITKLIYEAEKEFSVGTVSGDFDGQTADEHWKVNFVSARNSRGIPYHTLVMENDDAEAAIMVENSAVFAGGGSDGTMNNDTLNELTAEQALRYADPDDTFQEVLRWPQSVVIDSGYSLETKYALMSVMAIRKDIMCIISTFDAAGRKLTVSEESSLAVALRTRALLFPESEVYGTAAYRCIIVRHCGRLLGSNYKGKLPLTIEIAVNCANYMGAGTREWRNAYRFDGTPGSIVKLFADVENVIIPQSVRNQDWDNGLVSVQSYRLKTLFFPALKSVYTNDTSVLNSFINGFIMIECQKIGHRAWSEIVGRMGLTRQQIIEQNNEFITAEAEGVFDGLANITPETYFTADDIARNFSHHTKIKVEASGMPTASVLTIEARRLEQSAGTGS